MAHTPCKGPRAPSQPPESADDGLLVVLQNYQLVSQCCQPPVISDAWPSDFKWTTDHELFLRFKTMDIQECLDD